MEPPGHRWPPASVAPRGPGDPQQSPQPGPPPATVGSAMTRMGRSPPVFSPWLSVILGPAGGAQSLARGFLGILETQDVCPGPLRNPGQ